MVDLAKISAGDLVRFVISVGVISYVLNVVYTDVYRQPNLLVSFEKIGDTQKMDEIKVLLQSISDDEI